MRKNFTSILVLVSVLLVPSISAFAGCYVQDGTFYADGRLTMTRFVIAMGEGDKNKALQMVDDGRIKSCSQASCVVIKRTDEGLVNVHIVGIGKAWIYEKFLHCY